MISKCLGDPIFAHAHFTNIWVTSGHDPFKKTGNSMPISYLLIDEVALPPVRSIIYYVFLMPQKLILNCMGSRKNLYLSLCPWMPIPISRLLGNKLAKVLPNPQKFWCKGGKNIQNRAPVIIPTLIKVLF